MSYQIQLETNITINVENSNFKHITAKFLFALTDLFQQFVTAVLLHYFEEYYENGKLKQFLDIDNYRRKSTSVRTKFKTLFGDIFVPQIQIRTTDKDGKEHQISITRTLLGVSRKYQIPDFMKEFMAWIGAMTSYRVGHNIMGLLTNFKCSLMSVWNSVQSFAKKIKLELSPEGTNEFDADATGIPTTKSGKRGSELKKVFQRNKNGKLQLVGLTIGKYKNKQDWTEAFSEIKKAIESGLKKYEKIILASDGDLSIIDTAKAISEKIKIQKDKWHIFHQLKYYLWSDGVKKELKHKIIGHFFKKSMLSKRTIKERDIRINKYITLLRLAGFKHTVVYLQSAMNGFYTHETEGNSNIYTSKTERSMRTTNQRINIGVWSDDGALNVCKIRGVYYYNGISPLNWKNTA